MKLTPRRSLAVLAVTLALGAGGVIAGEAPASQSDLVPDRILVLKSERKLFLMAGDAIVRTIDISLGLMPEGPKQREGDFRTPEGRYYIESKNSSSDFFLSLKVSYPNADDRARARLMGVDPGGMIMIHGLPISNPSEIAPITAVLA